MEHANYIAEDFLQFLCCPECKGELDKAAAEGKLQCVNCRREMAMRGGILRAVGGVSYVSNFGAQWNRFRRTQIDEFSGVQHSRERFEAETGWDDVWLTGKVLLDAGCGAGRFAAVALRKGARVLCLDLSSAVDACHENLLELGFSPDQFLVVQASVFEMPIKSSSLDGAYSLGVVQHTPDPRGAVSAICGVVKPGGRVAIWAYLRSIRGLLYYKYWMRLVTAHLSQESNWRLSNWLVRTFWPAARFASAVPGFRRGLLRMLPFKFENPRPGDWVLAREWSLLDTFDNLAPRYDLPLTESELCEAMRSGGCEGVTRRLEAKGLAVVGELGKGSDQK